MGKLGALRKYATPLFFLLVIAFFVYYFRNIDLEKLTTVDVDYFNLSIGVMLLLLARFWLSFTWGQILKMLGVNNFKYVDLNYVYAKSWLGRYIPGKFTWILGKIYFAFEQGISKSKLSISSILEASLQVGVAILLGATLIFATDGSLINTKSRILMGGITIIMFIVLYPPVFSSLVQIAYKTFQKTQMELTGYNNNSLLKLMGYFSGFSVVSGIAFFYIINAFDSIELDKLPFIIGTSSLSGAAGILALIAPSGIGVKEGVQLVLLKSLLTDEAIVIVLIAGRLASILADILFYWLSLILVKIYIEHHAFLDRKFLRTHIKDSCLKQRGKKWSPFFGQLDKGNFCLSLRYLLCF